MGKKQFNLIVSPVLVVLILGGWSNQVQAQTQAQQTVRSINKIAKKDVGVIAEYDRQESGRQYDRLIIRNVMLIDGKGTPMRGPTSILIEKNKIASVGSARSRGNVEQAKERVIDGTGMYCLPGLINNHAHLQNSRGRLSMPFEYQYKCWLACGITTIRDVGSTTSLTLKEREKSRRGEIAAPRIFLYMRPGGSTPQQAREGVRRIKEMGADGVKVSSAERDIYQAVCEEANKLGLRVAHHVGVENTDAWDDAAFGTTSIEHWYGVPDAALHGTQKFPPWYNYNNEQHRFAYAGRLWLEADPMKLDMVLQTLVDKGVAWVPTFVIYEANRDLQRAMNQPWFKDYLHPTLEKYFEPNPSNHGSYHWNWTTTDEIFWKENYQIWMKAVEEFAKKGGVVGVGEDAGFIYMMYGFSTIRELELHQEAGFHPIDVIQHATENNARILGMEDQLGRLKAGYLADLILLDENPLENFKYLYPTGVQDLQDGKLIQRGGIKWTIKDGYVYHVPTILEELKQMVAEARKDLRLNNDR